MGEIGGKFLRRRIWPLSCPVFARNPSESDTLLADSFLTAFESEAAGMGKRQTNTEWSYGWGHVVEDGKVTFQPFEHWTGEAWQVGKERPLKDDPRSYLYADEGATHPGYTSKESAIYAWKAPADLRIAIRGVVERHNVNKGNGIRIKLASEKGGVLKDVVLPPSQKQIPMNLAELQVAENETIYFIVDPHENNSSFDSVSWSPQVIDLDGGWPKWGLAESFSGPGTPATPWSAYAHALLNTNRFLFID